VLTDYIGLSVGGTLSVGGIGAGSFRFGAQTDQIRSLTLVTGAGEILQCSPTRAPELFDAARAGLGQVGVITSVELSLIEVPPRVRHYRIPYPTIAALLADLDRLVDQAEFGQLSAVGLVGADGRWSFHIDAVVGFEIGHEPDDAAWLSSVSVNPAEVAVTDASYLEYSCRLDPVIEDWRASGLWQAPHPWVDVFVPGAALSKFAQAVVASLEPEDLGTEGGMILIYPIANTRTPLLPVDTRGGPAYLFDVLRCNPGADAARVEALLRHNREIFEEAVALGGSLYTISAVNMSPEDWRRQFGGQWDVLLATKRRHDPDGVMGSGYCALEG
jgi:FAD/FMN-containing dehydrogenase